MLFENPPFAREERETERSITLQLFQKEDENDDAFNDVGNRRRSILLGYAGNRVRRASPGSIPLARYELAERAKGRSQTEHTTAT